MCADHTYAATINYYTCVYSDVCQRYASRVSPDDRSNAAKLPDRDALPRNRLKFEVEIQEFVTNVSLKMPKIIDLLLFPFIISWSLHPKFGLLEQCDKSRCHFYQFTISSIRIARGVWIMCIWNKKIQTARTVASMVARKEKRGIGRHRVPHGICRSTERSGSVYIDT